MTLVKRPVSLIVSEEGKHVLNLSAGLPPSDFYSFVVDETDELGLWVKVVREGAEHVILVRWEYVLSVDVEVTAGREPGFQQARG